MTKTSAREPAATQRVRLRALTFATRKALSFVRDAGVLFDFTTRRCAGLTLRDVIRYATNVHQGITSGSTAREARAGSSPDLRREKCVSVDFFDGKRLKPRVPFLTSRESILIAVKKVRALKSGGHRGRHRRHFSSTLYAACSLGPDHQGS